jgi:ABC-type nitrate/sulfonate/bicarbonate transport system permease component
MSIGTADTAFEDAISTTQAPPRPWHRHPVWTGVRVFGRGLSYLWLFLGLFLLWQWRSRNHPSFFIPAPSDIIGRFHAVFLSGPGHDLFTTAELREHLKASLGRWVRGYVIACVLGVLLGTLFARVKRLNWMFQPLIRLGQSTPSIMLLPLFIILLGINDGMVTSVIVYASIWPVLVNTIDGVSSVDQATINAARAMRIRGFRLFRMVLLRAASPQILAGLRVSLGVSIILMIGAELYATTSGIGYYVTFSQHNLAFTDMFAGIMLAVIVGLLANGVFYLIERRVMRWRPKTREA